MADGRSPSYLFTDPGLPPTRPFLLPIQHMPHQYRALRGDKDQSGSFMRGSVDPRGQQAPCSLSL